MTDGSPEHSSKRQAPGTGGRPDDHDRCIGYKPAWWFSITWLTKGQEYQPVARTLCRG